MRALGTSLLIIPELRVLVLTKRHVGCGNEIGVISILVTALCAWAKHSTPTVPLSTLYEWVLANGLDLFTQYKQLFVFSQNYLNRKSPLYFNLSCRT